MSHQLPQRDFVGYGEHPPNPSWPNNARLAVSFVINYEEGSEYNLDQGDAQDEGGAFSLLECTIDRATTAVCAGSLGIMTGLNGGTFEHSKTRQQFGQPIGKNQDE